MGLVLTLPPDRFDANGTGKIEAAEPVASRVGHEGRRTLRGQSRLRSHRVSTEVASLISKVPQTITIAGVEFDNVTYEREGDVLYLWAGEPREPALDDASPEGHYLQFAPDGALIAVTIVNARCIFEREGKIPITLPEHRVEANDLAAVLTSA